MAAENFKEDVSILLGAPPKVMEETPSILSKKYGSVHKFLDKQIGFDASWQNWRRDSLDGNLPD